ncbi:MAG TPA: ABC transporter substrate-binding protein [Casimicrobiaceae bacterium]|jgi:ABC-type transport system substrate-binding protein|nr:ABC transporter substrate-binding protein [Casimicrobiaceae bacterium]
MRGFWRLASGVVALLIAASALAADPGKVLRIAFPVAETGFDPVKVSDLYSNTVNEAIFDTLLTYDYLARPAKLVPKTTDGMPEVSDGGRTYLIHLKRGIYFAPDPAFKGERRELVAEDYVYSFKRFADPKNRSPYAFMIQGRIEGLDDATERAKKTGRFDYDAVIPGMVALDKYTLRFKLTKVDYLFPYTLAHAVFGAVAREVIEAYASDTNGHPVGTGPYMLKEWRRGARIVLEANPNFREEVWDFQPTKDPWDRDVVAAMQGKTLPQIGRIEISVIEESQSRWLAFNRKELDLLAVPATFVREALDDQNNLKPEWVAQKVSLFRAIDPSIGYSFYNFRDPILGGFTREKIALRRAINMGYELGQEIAVIAKNQEIQAQMPIPYGVVGYDPDYRNVDQYDPALANKLLDWFGYKRGADGYRTLPDGKPMVIHMATGTAAIDREYSELWKRSMDAIGIRMVFDPGKFADQLKAAKACQLMMWQAAWTADYPDGDNFMQLFYGPNTGESNNGCYESKAFDALYERSLTLPPASVERQQLFIDMTRQEQVDGAWSLHSSPIRNQLIRPWVKGYKKHPILNAEWVYMDLEPRS